MKLLLTSAGITNRQIADALEDLVGKPARAAAIAFIPTAANVEAGDKGWLIEDYARLKKLGYTVDIVDISALPKDIWLPRLRSADVLLFGGGNTSHLMHWIRRSSLEQLLPSLLRKRVYVGLSAGSIVASAKLSLTQSKRLYAESLGTFRGDRGLGFVRFHIRPHLNSLHFPRVRRKFLKRLAAELSERIFAIDDDTAIKVEHGRAEVLGKGKHFVFN